MCRWTDAREPVVLQDPGAPGEAAHREVDPGVRARDRDVDARAHLLGGPGEIDVQLAVPYREREADATGGVPSKPPSSWNPSTATRRAGQDANSSRARAAVRSSRSCIAPVTVSVP